MTDTGPRVSNIGDISEVHYIDGVGKCMNSNRGNGLILVCLLVSLEGTPLVAAGQAGANSSSQRRDVAPELVSRYFQRMLELMPNGKEKEGFKGENPQDWVGYGVETC